jgi:hypothetical protein
MSTDSTDVGGLSRPKNTAETPSDKVVLTDTVTGTKYVLKISDGVLLTEEVA